MSNLEFFVTPGFGEKLGNMFNYSQAVRHGDRIELSGHGGWTDDLEFPADITEEIALAFANVERTLTMAGASFGDVMSVVSYHVPLYDSPAIEDEVYAAVNAEFRSRMPDRAPTWTAVTVPKLGVPGMRVEVAVVALVEAE